MERIDRQNKGVELHTIAGQALSPSAPKKQNTLDTSSIVHLQSVETDQPGCFQSFLNSILNFFRRFFCCGTSPEKPGTARTPGDTTPTDEEKDNEGEQVPPSSSTTEASTGHQTRVVDTSNLGPSRSSSFKPPEPAHTQQPATTRHTRVIAKEDDSRSSSFRFTQAPASGSNPDLDQIMTAFNKAAQAGEEDLESIQAQRAALLTSSEALPEDASQDAVPEQSQDSTPATSVRKYSDTGTFLFAPKPPSLPAVYVAPATPSSNRKGTVDDSGDIFAAIKKGVGLNQSEEGKSIRTSQTSTEPDPSTTSSRASVAPDSEAEEDDWDTDPNPIQASGFYKPGIGTVNLARSGARKLVSNFVMSQSQSSSTTGTKTEADVEEFLQNVEANEDLDEDERALLQDLAAKPKKSRPTAAQVFAPVSTSNSAAASRSATLQSTAPNTDFKNMLQARNSEQNTEQLEAMKQAAKGPGGNPNKLQSVIKQFRGSAASSTTNTAPSTQPPSVHTSKTGTRNLEKEKRDTDPTNLGTQSGSFANLERDSEEPEES